jgi:hypothetical protein
MFANAAVQVRVVFSDVAKHALDPDTDWRRERDSNPRGAVNPHTLSRRAT